MVHPSHHSEQVRIWPCCHTVALTITWHRCQDEKMLGHSVQVCAQTVLSLLWVTALRLEAQGDACDWDKWVRTLMESCFVPVQEVDVIRSCQERMQRYLDRAKAQLA